MSTATSLLGSPIDAEQLARLLASPGALWVLPGDTAAEGTVLTEMAESDGVTEIAEPAPPEETDEELAARFERGRDAGVAACTLGLGERPVRDFVDQVGFEMELVAVEFHEVSLGETLEQQGRIVALGEAEHRRDRAGRADHRAVFQQRTFRRIPTFNN